MIFDNQLRHALGIIDAYRGASPLHVWLKDFFRVNKQMGARDRRLLSAMVYGFYRLGHAQRDQPPRDRLLTGLFLCNDQPNDLLHHFRPDWDPTASLTEKIAATGLIPTDIFPWKNELSDAIDHQAFCLSFLRQPDLFIRIRPGHEQTVRKQISGEFIPPSTLRLPIGFKIEEHLIPDREIVIQDYSSQRVAEFLKTEPSPQFFYDACAASGGKSILAHDLYPDMDITVSDIRENILHNLRTRFRVANITRYRSFIIDLATQHPPESAANADLILTDVPCTGSGTWSRTPEQLYFFQPEKIAHYHALQKNIVRNAGKPKTLVYCTCSVFKKENEEIVEEIQKLGMKLDRAAAITGYDHRADTLFAARFEHKTRGR